MCCYFFIFWFSLSVFWGVCMKVAELKGQTAVTQQTLICIDVTSIKKGFITVIDLTNVFSFSSCG